MGHLHCFHFLVSLCGLVVGRVVQCMAVLRILLLEEHANDLSEQCGATLLEAAGTVLPTLLSQARLCRDGSKALQWLT